MKVKARATMVVMGLFAYLLLSVTCWQNAYATDTLDKMIAHARCVASAEMVRWVLDEQGQTGIAQYMEEMKEFYTLNWPWSDEEYASFANGAYHEFRDGLRSGELEWKTVVQVAMICAKHMDEAQNK